MALTKVRGSGIDADGQEIILDADQDTTLSVDTDDQVDIKIGGTDRAVFLANNMHLIGGTVARVQLSSSGSGTTPNTGNNNVHIEGNDDTLVLNAAGNGNIIFQENGGEAMRIDSSGIILIGTTDTNPGNNTSGSGIVLNGSDGKFSSAVNQSEVMVLNRMGNDGTVLLIRQDGSSEGSIGVSGATVSFDGFVGRHESSGISTSTPKGTVLTTIDELDVYVDGNKKDETRADHAKVKVSDAVGDSSVYGVVDTYTDVGKVMVASVGIGSVRVTGACAKGDLLESNGDGTAKVQSDDIVRSKTIGKVTIGNSNTGVKLVSCVLYCG